MTVFKTFWKCVHKNIGMIILYTVMLLTFGVINMKTSDNSINFTSTKPDVFIKNEDNSKISDNLVKYIKENSNIIHIDDEDILDDALFYRDINYIIYIPKNYGENVLKELNPTINIKTTGDYNASLAEIMLSRYIKVQNSYATKIKTEDELISLINNNLSKKVNIEMNSKLDTNKTTNASFYFNFASYSIMAVIIFVICLVMTSFKEKTIKKRIIVGSMNYKKHSRILLLSSFIYSIIVWILYCLLGLIILKDTLISLRGLIYILNAFVFTFCSLTLALLISSLINNKTAVSGIVNVVSLGSAFLCGAFVPTEFLPNTVLNMAHILPAYWYINSNDLLKTIEIIDGQNLKPIFINMIVLVIFSIGFIIINNIVNKKRQQVG